MILGSVQNMWSDRQWCGFRVFVLHSPEACSKKGTVGRSTLFPGFRRTLGAELQQIGDYAVCPGRSRQCSIL